MGKSERMKELVQLLNQASKAYYQDAEEMMTNLEYDRLYDELVALEKETGIVLSNSPTVNVGYEVISELQKERHAQPMLSLDKTKEVSRLAEFIGDKKGVLSWKLDGLTVVLTYRHGVLEKALTRGNGQVGEVITANVKTFENIPLSIPYQGSLTLRGEAVIRYSDFEKINMELPDADAKYKNPRNLCSGSVRQKNSEITAKRKVRFIAFALVEAENMDFQNSVAYEMQWLSKQGFEVVERKMVYAATVRDAVHYFEEKVKTYDYPSDGLVLMYDDLVYGTSLGTTAKFPRNGIAFKWEDEQVLTTLQSIEWSPSRTGLINPVAVFEPVELEGTTVSRASVHNISIMEELKLGIGDMIKVYKANMIIPQIAENLTKSGIVSIPTECPACGESTKIQAENGVKTLYCVNRDCPAKNIKAYTLFVSGNAMDIEGLSEETLEKFIDRGYIHEFADIYHLDRYEEDIIAMPGFGKKSFHNLQNAVKKSRRVTLHAFLYGLGIPNTGVANAKLICKAFDGDLEQIMNAKPDRLMEIDGIGEIMAQKISAYFKNEKNVRQIKNLLHEVTIVSANMQNTDESMSGLTFVVTGSLTTFQNRDALKNYIENHGGKVTGSVTSKTDYLINNDIHSGSSKNKKAKELNIPIITEARFLEQWQKNAETSL